MAKPLIQPHSSAQASQGTRTANWHAQEAAALFKNLNSSSQGLSDAEVAEKQQQVGKNILPSKRAYSPLMILLRQFKSPLIYILLIAAIVSVVIGDIKDASFIMVVILLNALIGAYQEWKAEKSAAALQELLKTYAHTRRNRNETHVDAEELVPGDLVYLESGSRVPADLRILEANKLYVDESMLTGESDVVHKNATVLPDESLSINEQTNMMFAGTIVTTGRATSIVVSTGLATELGKIAEAVSGSKGGESPLLIRMERFSKWIGYLVLLSCALLGVVAMFKGIPPQEVFFMSVALAVSAIPEGLPVAMTIALSVATSRMSQRKVLIRKLMAVEGLGSCTIIATDKTGTLTINRQTVRLVHIDGQPFHTSGEGYQGEGHITRNEGQPLEPAHLALIQTLAKTAILCNEANLYQDENDRWQAEGDPVDIALLALGYKARLMPDEVRQSVQEIETIPYESERMYAALYYRDGQENKVAIKGASEVLLPRCHSRLTLNGESTFNLQQAEAELEHLSQQGYRVLVIAQGKVNNSVIDDTSELPDLTFLGFVALLDPLRPEAKTSIEECRQAGIKVAMVTGDHPATAMAIGQQLNLIRNSDELMTGKHLNSLESASRAEVVQAIQKASVFARVAPLQKLQIVEALKEAGHYVAVTGDGVNDAPALKSAHIGVAMGTGTDVAKDAASIIITDDNFASLVSGVEEGRFAYDNIRKVIYLLISTGIAEVILFIMAVFSNLPLPLMAVQLLWLNLVTNGLQHVALAFEKGEPEAIHRPPRKPDEDIFNPQMTQQTVISGIVMAIIAFSMWYTLLNTGWEEASARNLVLLLMVLMENVHVFNCRSELQSTFRIPIHTNWLLLFSVLAAQGIHIAAMHIPFMQQILQVQPVAMQEWVISATLALTLLIVMELFKGIKRKQIEKRNITHA